MLYTSQRKTTYKDCLSTLDLDDRALAQAHEIDTFPSDCAGPWKNESGKESASPRNMAEKKKMEEEWNEAANAMQTAADVQLESKIGAEASLRQYMNRKEGGRGERGRGSGGAGMSGHAIQKLIAENKLDRTNVYKNRVAPPFMPNHQALKGKGVKSSKQPVRQVALESSSSSSTRRRRSLRGRRDEEEEEEEEEEEDVVDARRSLRSGREDDLSVMNRYE